MRCPPLLSPWQAQQPRCWSPVVASVALSWLPVTLPAPTPASPGAGLEINRFPSVPEFPASLENPTSLDYCF